MTITKADLKAVAQGIRDHDDYVISVHENPDGDALGSMLALKLALDQLGKRSTMFLTGNAPIPFEYRFMALDGLVRGEPGDLLGRPLLSLDAANEARLGSDRRLLDEASFVAVIAWCEVSSQAIWQRPHLMQRSWLISALAT